MPSPSISIDWCPTSRIADLQAFIHEQWKPGHVLSRDTELLRWQFPEVTPGKISVFVAEDSGRIVGMFGVIPTPLNVRGQKHPGAMTANWVTHADYRDQPLGLQLLKRVMASGYAMVGTLGANALTLRLLGAMRFKLIERVPRMLRVFSPADCRRLQLAAGETGAAGVALPADEEVAEVEEVAGDWQIADWSGDLAAAWDEAWRKSFATTHCGVWRDTAYLQWRYVNHPRFRYRLRAAVESATGRIGGLAVYRIAPILHRQEQVLRIVEFLATEDADRALGADLHQAGKAENVAFADFYTTSRSAREQLQRVGFEEEEVSAWNLPALFSPLDFRRTKLTGAFWFAPSAGVPAASTLLDGDYYFTRADGDQDRPN